MFFQDQIEYCGYGISKNSTQISMARVYAIYNIRRPTNQSEVIAYLGLINYYARFFRNLSDLLYPLNRLLCHDKKFA